jgi:hypothetical protein
VSDINRGLHGSEKAASSITVEGAVCRSISPAR